MVFGQEGMVNEIKSFGLHAELLKPLLEGETEYSSTFTDTDVARFKLDGSVRAIAKGVCGEFDQRKLAVASFYLQNKQTLFVATNDDPVFIAGAKQRLMPDVGSTLASLEKVSGRKATRVGKPGTFALEAILGDHFDKDRNRWKEEAFLKQFCYVGDNLQTDIRFGKESGIGTVLVLSGITSERDVDKIEQIKPDFVLKRFSPCDEDGP